MTAPIMGNLFQTHHTSILLASCFNTITLTKVELYNYCLRPVSLIGKVFMLSMLNYYIQQDLVSKIVVPDF